MDDDEEDYKVGYGKPPQATRFVKGTSGNPAGRPKGSRSMLSILRDIAAKRVIITEGGQTRMTSIKEAVVMQLATSAARGDRHARKEFLHLTGLAEAEEQSAHRARVPHERDKAALEGVMKRLLTLDPNDIITAEDPEEGT